MKPIHLSVCVLVLLTGCSYTIGERWDKPATITFGTIVDAHPIEVTEVDDVELVGGFVGIDLNALDPQSRRNVRKRLAKPEIYRYTIRRPTGGLVSYATEKRFMQRGDCVAIEQGAALNLRLVPDTNCAPNRPKQQRKATPAQETAASQCLLAKRQLVLAQTPQQTDAANRQVENLCQYQRN